MRLPLVLGNWKMNHCQKDLDIFLEDFKRTNLPENVEYGIAPVSVYLRHAVDSQKGAGLKIGAQDCHEEISGAFTGDISVEMLEDIGVDFVILGHSERRQNYRETNQRVNRKVKTVLRSGIFPVVCVGETLEDRQAAKTRDLVGLSLIHNRRSRRTYA
jgi:triosephosphate isomerase